MERLTKRIGEHVYYTKLDYSKTIPSEYNPNDIGRILQALCAYEDTNHTPEECAAAFEELAEYRAAEQDGTLLRMAYPVGSYVFVSPNKGKAFHKARIFGKNEKGAYLVWLCDESLDENEKHIVKNPMTKFFYDWFHQVYSKEEAEAALKEQEANQ